MRQGFYYLTEGIILFFPVSPADQLLSVKLLLRLLFYKKRMLFIVAHFGVNHGKGLFSSGLFIFPVTGMEQIYKCIQ